MKALVGTAVAAVLTLGTDHFFGIVPAVFVLVLTASIVATITLDSPPTDNYTVTNNEERKQQWN